MAVYNVEFGQRNLIGYSSDTKPAGRPGQIFHEVNTGVEYVWDGESWVDDLRVAYSVNRGLKD